MPRIEPRSTESRWATADAADLCGIRGLPRRAVVPRGHPHGVHCARGGALCRAGRLRGVHDRFAATGTVALCRRVRPARCGAAAQRAEGPRVVTDVELEGSARPPRQGLLRKARARQGDARRAAHGSALPCDMGHASSGGGEAAEPQRARRAEGPAQGMGDGHVGPAHRVRRRPTASRARVPSTNCRPR